MGNKKNPKTTHAPKAPALQYQKFTALGDLITVAGPAPVVVERIVTRDGKQVGITLEGRRLNPNEVMEVNILLESALPPELPLEKPSDPPRYDFRNPAYLRDKAMNQRRARAAALIYAFPIFANAFKETEAGKKANPSHEEMFKFIESQPVEDDLLETAFQQLTKCVISVDWERVVFTSGGNSLKS